MTDTDSERDDRAEHGRTNTDPRSSRRRLLRVTAGVALTAGVAGCSGLGGGDSGDGVDGTDTTVTTETATDTAAETTADDGTATADEPRTDATTSDDAEDGTEDGTADPSNVAFDFRWQERIDYQQTINSRNFGADATADGVFLGGEWGFAALDLNDGSRTWEKSEWEGSGFVDVHADQDGVVAYTRTFEVVSFDPSDGTERWRASTAGSENARFSSALTPSYVVVESADGVVVYERSSGDVTAEVGLESSPRNLVATDEVLVVPQSGGVSEVIVYDVASGSERWRTEVILDAGAVVDDGRIVGLELGVGPDATNSLVALDLDGGDRLWTEESGRGRGTSIAVENGVAAYMSGSMSEPHTLYAHSLDDGTQLWSEDVNDVRAPFTVMGSGVVVAPATTEDNRAKVRAYGAESGEQLAETDGGLSVTEAAAVDRVFLEIDLTSVLATEF